MGPTALRFIRAMGDTLSNVESQVFTPYIFGSTAGDRTPDLLTTRPTCYHATVSYTGRCVTGSSSTLESLKLAKYCLPYFNRTVECKNCHEEFRPHVILYYNKQYQTKRLEVTPLLTSKRNRIIQKLYLQ